MKHILCSNWLPKWARRPWIALILRKKKLLGVDLHVGDEVTKSGRRQSKQRRHFG